MAASTPVVLSGAVEGLVDQAALRRLAKEADAVLGPVHGLNGKDRLLKQLKGYNVAAKSAPWIVLVDLHRDGECAPPRCRLWLPKPARRMCFRIAVRTVEAWLLADRGAIAKFLGVPVSRVPLKPDAIDDPKQLVVNLARRSRNRTIREDMVPDAGTGRKTGPRYSDRLIEFVDNDWQPQVAARQSDSLHRCRERVKELIANAP